MNWRNKVYKEFCNETGLPRTKTKFSLASQYNEFLFGLFILTRYIVAAKLWRKKTKVVDIFHSQTKDKTNLPLRHCRLEFFSKNLANYKQNIEKIVVQTRFCTENWNLTRCIQVNFPWCLKAKFCLSAEACLNVYD